MFARVSRVLLYTKIGKIMDKYYQHADRKWDLFRSTVDSRILARSGWVEISREQYLELRDENWKANERSGL